MVDPHTPAWVEPGLPAALAKLSEGQRTSVMLVHTFEYTFAEAAELLGVSKSTIQTQVERGMDRLRIELVCCQVGSLSIVLVVMAAQ